MAAHTVFKVGAVVSSLLLAGGVIGYRVARVNDRQAATPSVPGTPSTPATESSMLMSGSKSRALDLTPPPARDPAMLMPGPKSDVMMPSSKDVVPLIPVDNPVPSHEMLMSGSKTIIFADPKTGLTQEQIMLMAGSKSAGVVPPPSTVPATRPATKPATGPATAPAGKTTAPAK